MRMSLLILTLVPLATASAQTFPMKGRDAVEATKKCPPVAGLVSHSGGSMKVRPLGEMPPASRVLTVYREVDGCFIPVVLQTGIGGDTDPAPRPSRR